jgi:hypothetical protein
VKKSIVALSIAALLLTASAASAQVCAVAVIAAAIVASARDHRELTQDEAMSCGAKLLIEAPKPEKKPGKKHTEPK